MIINSMLPAVFLFAIGLTGVIVSFFWIDKQSHSEAFAFYPLFFGLVSALLAIAGAFWLIGSLAVVAINTFHK